MKVISKTIAMINAMPKTSDRVFNATMQVLENNFACQRKKIVLTLQSPRLNQIHFHTLHHWKATMEEAKALIETGFEYVTDMENIKLFRKRK